MTQQLCFPLLKINAYTFSKEQHIKEQTTKQKEE